MIKAISGIIVKKEPTCIWLKLSNGITYAVSISLFTSAKLELGLECEFLITQIIKEDANLLFGFLEASEQKIFELMLKVNGIGTTTALAICSTLDPASVQIAVKNNDIATFKKVPGIGDKTARLLLAQLSDASFINTNENPIYTTALLALESLGFKKDAINLALNKCSGNDVQALIKQALQILNKAK